MKKGRRFTAILAGVFCAAVLSLGELELLAGKVEKGDQVEVFFLGKWWPATAVDVDRRGGVLAEFEFAGGSKRDGFSPDKVRLACEAGAIAPVRQWSDASGNFKIQAALLGIDGEAVRLRKKDMAEIEVPISQLSDSDQRFVTRLQKQAGTSAIGPPKVPPVEPFSIRQSFGTQNAPGGTVAERAAIAPDPLPSYLALQQGGTGFPLETPSDRIGSVLPVGGPDGWILASVESEGAGQSAPTRLLWVSLVRGKVENKLLLPPGESVIDYHPPSHRLLTSGADPSQGVRAAKSLLTVWEVLPTDDKVTPVVRWDSQGEIQAREIPWARLIDGNTVLQKWKKQEYVGWDLTQKGMRYRLNQEAFFAPAPVLSGGRKYLFVPEDAKVSIYETATGRRVSVLPSTGGSAAVAVTEDGRQAAVLGRNTLTVWDLVDATAPPEPYQAEAIGTPFNATLAWVGDQRLMAGSGGNLALFSLRHRLALWSYQFDNSAVSDWRGGRTREIVAGHLVYAATFNERGQRGLAVGAVTLPGPNVDDVDASLDRRSLLVLQPGSSIRIDVKADQFNDQVRAAIERQVADNGWISDPAAPIVLTAEMKRGETQQVTYDFSGRRPQETVSVTPYISSVRIDGGGQTAWTAGTSSGAPGMIALSEKQSAQEEVNRWQKPNPGFFEKLDLPEEIMDPKYRNGVGATLVTNRGLVPK